MSDQELSKLVCLGKGLFDYPSQLINERFGSSFNGLSSLLSFGNNGKRLFLANSPSQLFTVIPSIAGDIFLFGNIF